MLSPWQSLSDPLPPSATRLEAPFLHFNLMDSTASPPPYRHHHSRLEPPSRTKSALRLANLQLRSLGLIQSPSPPSRKSSASLPLHELLLLSPSPNPRKSKTRLADRFEMPDEFGPLCALPNFIYNG